MAPQYTLDFTAHEINERLRKVNEPIDWDTIVNKPIVESEGNDTLQAVPYYEREEYSYNGDAYFKLSDVIVNSEDLKNGVRYTVSQLIKFNYVEHHCTENELLEFNQNGCLLIDEFILFVNSYQHELPVGIYGRYGEGVIEGVGFITIPGFKGFNKIKQFNFNQTNCNDVNELVKYKTIISITQDYFVDNVPTVTDIRLKENQEYRVHYDDLVFNCKAVKIKKLQYPSMGVDKDSIGLVLTGVLAIIDDGEQISIPNFGDEYPTYTFILEEKSTDGKIDEK